MEPTKEHLSYIYTMCKIGITPRYFHEELVHVYVNDAPSIKTFIRWNQHFVSGKEAMISQSVRQKIS